MRTKIPNLNILMLLTALIMLSACGIDRGGIDQPLESSGGVVAGKIESIDTANNTLSINGQQLDVGSSTILVNGVAANLGDLAAGMYAASSAPFGIPLLKPAQLRVDFNAAGGPLDFDPAQMTFELFGQTVSLDNFQSNSSDQPLPASGPQSIAVSGYITSQNIIAATSVTSYDANNPFIVTGVAQQIDNANSTFDIGVQRYSFSQAVNIATANGMLSEQARVRLQLAPGSANNALNVLTVVDAPLIDPSVVADATISLSGYVTSIADSSHFSVSFIQVATNNSTNFNNLLPTDLAVDQLINIEGTLLQDRTVLIRTATLLE